MTAAEASVATILGFEHAYFDAAPELLSAMADDLDIECVFPGVSRIAKALVPHDALVLALADAAGELVVRAATGDLLEVDSCMINMRSTERIVVGDLRVEPFPVDCEDLEQRALAAGYRAFMSVTARARGQLLTLQFWSKRPFAFGRHDLPMAHRVAGHIALAVAHQRLAERGRGDSSGEPPLRSDRVSSSRAPERPTTTAPAGDPRVVGDSPQWREALLMATHVAATDTTVLVTGESGTGKEVLARFIHRNSPRHRGPFVALNCAALPEHLLESELFGFERGAFTGAQQPKPGMIELAAGGVLFLDEVSEMSPSAQAKLLRVLQEREFQRLGGTRVLKANIRVMAATNRDLRQAVDRGEFREDLYYRLQVFPIAIPPLRERRDDILPLCTSLLREIGAALRRPPADLTRNARQALTEHEWPGNVRELRNALERATILSQGGPIGTEHLGLCAAVAAPCTVSSDLGTLERATISRVLGECRGNKSAAARRLGLSRTQLYFRLRKHGLAEQAAA